MRLDAWTWPYWEPRDIWVGVYWSREYSKVAKHEAYEWLDVYVCLVPCFPVRLTFNLGHVPVRAAEATGGDDGAR